MNNFNIVAWNVRGLNDPRKRGRVGSWSKHRRADLVCLAETKLDWMDDFMARSIFRQKGAGDGWSWQLMERLGVFC